ncbi:CAP domain-containing protein [Flavobacterium sp.]|uniref:CAP domain-containing protein n=1 Tax=Flavobacterium sp. TaxID=239 RepID=UPI0026248302|nr:CAP domain-containing protein [Flavobacterium sp.]
MKTTLLRAVVPMAFLFTLISCSSSDSAEETSAAKPQLIQNYEYNSDELQLADLINEHRVSLGLNPLQLINHVSYKSEEHNEYMIARKVVNHDLFPERSENIIEVLGAVKVNENVAYNFVSSNSALNAWLNSPGHKSNIEGNFTHFGISIRQDETTGKKYYTNIFVKK